MKMCQFWSERMTIALVFCPKSPKLRSIEFECRVKRDENELIFGEKIKAIALEYCRKMSEIEIQ